MERSELLKKLLEKGIDLDPIPVLNQVNKIMKQPKFNTNIDIRLCIDALLWIQKHFVSKKCSQVSCSSNKFSKIMFEFNEFILSLGSILSIKTFHRNEGNYMPNSLQLGELLSLLSVVSIRIWLLINNTDFTKLIHQISF